MRVMIDTNVPLSALLYPGPRMNALMYRVASEHQLILSSYVVDELWNVIRRKFAGREEAVDQFLSRLPYELVYTPKQPTPGLFAVRDSKDYPILYTAIVEDVDLLITGDKDFLGLPIERPRILTPSEFLAME